MIELKKGYLVSDHPVPLFNKRRDGRFYAKLSLDTYASAKEVDEVSDEVEESIAKFRSKLAQIKRSMRADKIPNLYHHQSVAVSLMLNNTDIALFMEQGTGKTLSVLTAVDMLYAQGEVSKVLVICPKRVIREWMEQASKFNIKVPVSKLTDEPKEGINLINYEMAWRKGFKVWDMVILDESHKIQNAGTKQSKFVQSIQRKRLVSMTGTSGEKPEHYYGQFKVIEPMMFGESLHNFKELFTNYDRVTGVVWGLKRSKRDKFWARVHSMSYWVRKDECLDLPEQIMEFSYVELPKPVMKLHKDLETKLIGQLDGVQYAVQSKMVAIGKCHQIAQGWLEGKCLHSAKLKAMQDLDIEEPVVIFTSYKKDVEELLSIYPNASVVDGSRDDSERFRNGETDVLIANYVAGSEGLNLQRAHLMVFYSLTYSYRMYSQAMSRIHRIGQEHKCVYIHLIAEGTVDERILNALQKKEDFVEGGINHERKLLTEENH